MLEHQLESIMITKEGLFDDLNAIKQLDLPQCYIAAGYIRNYCWDYLSNYEKHLPLNDVDIIYYDPQNVAFEQEVEAEQRLNKYKPQYNWSVKNQARMHLTNGTLPYSSTLDAMRHWPETATAVGMRLDDTGRIEIIAPYGLDDLFHMQLRKTDLFTNVDYYYMRHQSKGWLERWPKLRLVDIR